MEKKTKIVFIVNPISGTSDKEHIIDLIPEYLDSRRFEWAIRKTEHKGHAAEFANEAISEGVDVVVAVGGDGTVREVAEGVSGSRTALGIIPMGLTNTLARHLGIPLRGNASLTWLNHSEPVLCDSLDVLIDGEQRLTAVTNIAAGDTRLINCAQGVKTSIQDGEMEVEVGGQQSAIRSQKLNFSGTVLIDNEEYHVEHSIEVKVKEDSVYVQVPKRF